MPDDDRVSALIEAIIPYAAWIQNAAAQQNRLQVVQELAEEFGPGFLEFFGSSQAREFLTTHPVIAEAIRAAETVPALSTGLRQLYESSYQIVKAQEQGTPMHGSTPGTQVDQASQRIAQNAFSQPDSGVVVETPAEEAGTEGTSRRLSSSESRKEIISNFESRQGQKPLDW